MVVQPALITVPQDWKPWKTEKCCVCGGGFSEKSWDERHSHPQTGGDCHWRCCPWCKDDAR
jgi:hypothetical protein